MDIASSLPVVPRYSDHRGLIEQIVMEAVKEHLNRRQGTDNITRNFLRFLTSVCGLIEVRMLGHYSVLTKTGGPPGITQVFLYLL